MKKTKANKKGLKQKMKQIIKVVWQCEFDAFTVTENENNFKWRKRTIKLSYHNIHWNFSLRFFSALSLFISCYFLLELFDNIIHFKLSIFFCFSFFSPFNTCSFFLSPSFLSFKDIHIIPHIEWNIVLHLSFFYSILTLFLFFSLVFIL